MWFPKALPKEKPMNQELESKYWLIKTQATGGYLWWKPHGRGYTNNILEAGLFSKQQAHTDRPIDHAVNLAEVIREIQNEIDLCQNRIASGSELLIMFTEEQEDKDVSSAISKERSEDRKSV